MAAISQALDARLQLPIQLQPLMHGNIWPGPQCMSAISGGYLHRTSPVWGANRRLTGQSNSELNHNDIIQGAAVIMMVMP
jgi:hypothetical protein